MRELFLLVMALFLGVFVGESVVLASSPAAAETTSTSKSSVAKTASSNKKRVLTRSWRSGQQKPTKARCKEIQKALADKGYLDGPIDGIWGPQSMKALKEFQRDQDLTPDGKITALSLIALGLGPDYDSEFEDAQSRSAGVKANP